jgi:hypothetical protein
VLGSYKAGKLGGQEAGSQKAVKLRKIHPFRAFKLPSIPAFERTFL